MDFDVVMTTFAAPARRPERLARRGGYLQSLALRQPWCATLYQNRRTFPHG